MSDNSLGKTIKNKPIENKMLFIFLLAFLCILLAGTFALYSLNGMRSKLEQLSRPNENLHTLIELHKQVIKLNRVYRRYNFSNEELVDETPIIDTINVTINYLKQSTDEETIARLDSVSRLLDNIRQSTKEIAEIRQTHTNKSVTSELIKELSSQISSYTQYEDSSYVVRKQLSKVTTIENPYRYVDSVAASIKHEPNKTGLFKRIASFLGKKEKETVELTTTKKSDTTYTIVNTQDSLILDTVVTEVLDSVTVLYSNQRLIASLQEFLKELYMVEMHELEEYYEQEKILFDKNSRLLQIVESILADMEETAYLSNKLVKKDAYDYADFFTRILLFIVLFFVLIGVLLLYYLFRDVRRSKTYEIQLLEEKNKASIEAKARRDLLTTMSHEIRSPLTSIIGYTQFLDDSVGHVKSIKHASKHLLNIANEILDLSKIEMGVIEVKNEQTDLIDTLRKTAESFIITTEEKNITYEVNIPDKEIPFVKVDAYRLNQIVYNLLHNAVKFTETGFVKIDTDFELFDEDKLKVDIQISDSGIGIPYDVQPFIFEEYRQGGKSYREKGVGLGLGIVRKMIHLLGGEISFKSVPDNGTVFTLSFVFECDNQAYIPNNEVKYDETLLSGISILVIDDDILIARFFEALLKKYGAQVTVLVDSRQAVQHIEKNRKLYDLALIDMQMPYLSGTALFGLLHKHPKKPRKLIICTANVLRNEKEEQIMSQFDAVIYKPVVINHFIRNVANVLGIDLLTHTEQTPVIETQQRYDLKDLRIFSGDDPEVLNEILNDYYTDNKRLLAEAETASQTQDLEKLYNVVHQLTSRFRQIYAVLSDGSKEVEEKLRKRTAGENKAGTDILLFEWIAINEAIGLEIENQK